MKNRYERFVRRKGSEPYNYPPIPKNYVYLFGTPANGFVIQNKTNGSWFTWVPVDYLKANGTADGENFGEKFGRRNFGRNLFSKKDFHEEITCERILQSESIKKYGGFYISSFRISRTLCSTNCELSWLDVSYQIAKDAALKFERSSEDVLSHLTLGSEFDSMVEWLKDGKVKEDENGPSINHIYDLADGISEWTQEAYGEHERVIRKYALTNPKTGGIMTYRSSEFPVYSSDSVGFRIALYIK